MMGLDDGRGIVISLFDSSSLVVAVYVAAFFLKPLLGGLVVGIFFCAVLFVYLIHSSIHAYPAGVPRFICRLAEL